MFSVPSKYVAFTTIPVLSNFCPSMYSVFIGCFVTSILVTIFFLTTILTYVIFSLNTTSIFVSSVDNLFSETEYPEIKTLLPSNNVPVTTIPVLSNVCPSMYSVFVGCVVTSILTNIFSLTVTGTNALNFPNLISISVTSLPSSFPFSIV